MRLRRERIIIVRVRIEDKCERCDGTGGTGVFPIQECSQCQGLGVVIIYADVFLCLGGPHNGLLMPTHEAGDEYIQYEVLKGKTQTFVSVKNRVYNPMYKILVHSSLLKSSVEEENG